MKHTLTVLVENHYGELARIVSLFSARGYNIESLTVAETLDTSLSRVTIVTNGDDHTVEQIVKQLNKQVRVLEAKNLTAHEHLERELALIDVQTDSHSAIHQILDLVSKNHLTIVEMNEASCVLETTGDSKHVSEVVKCLEPFGIREITRTGTVAIARQ